jgi:nicotinamidase-related amidase
VEHCLEGREGWQLDPAIAKALEGCIVVTKPSFGSTELPGLIENVFEDMADGKGYEIELIGLCTDICVVSNALLLKASFPEAEIAVDEKCCAGVTPAKHEAALETMKSCQIDII